MKSSLKIELPSSNPPLLKGKVQNTPRLRFNFLSDLAQERGVIAPLSGCATALCIKNTRHISMLYVLHTKLAIVQGTADKMGKTCLFFVAYLFSCH